MKYIYELHFPYGKELFESDLEFGRFLRQFNSEDGVENKQGEVVLLPQTGGVTGRMLCYVKQKPAL